MADPFIGEVRLLPFTYAPSGWALCQGQLLPIAQNTALFSILGVMYGGNGKNIFGLPDMQGNVVVGAGAGPGLTSYVPGEMGGERTQTLTPPQMPAHSHNVMAVGARNDPNASIPSPDVGLSVSKGGNAYIPALTKQATMNAAALAPSAGGGGAHTNMMPTLSLNYCIAMTGVFPPRP